MSTPVLVRRVAFVALLLLAAAPLRSNAAWIPDGVPLSPPPIGQPSHSLRGLLADGSNGAFAVWLFADPFPDFSGTHYEFTAQRVDVLGNRPAPWTAPGSAIRSWADNSGFGTYNITPLPLLDDAAGGAIAPVIDDNFSADYIHTFRLYHVAPGGSTGPLPAFAGFPAFDASADADGSGGAVVICLRQTFAPPLDPLPPSPLFVQRVDAGGNSLWPVGGAGGPELVPAGQATFGLASLGDGAGGAFFAWTDLRDAGEDIYVQHVDAAGAIAAGWPVGGVLVCGASGLQTDPRLASDGAGGVFVVWRDERSGTARIFAHGVLAGGTLAPGVPLDGQELPSSGLDDRLANLASDGFGGCFVVRASLMPTFDGRSSLHRLDATLQPRPGWPAEGITLNTLSPGSGAVGLLADGLGGAFVSYRNGFGNVAPEGLYAQHFAGNATLAPGWTPAGYRLSGTGQDSRIVRSASGAIVAWTDTRIPWRGVYAQRIVIDGPVATELSLVGASAQADRVTLEWFAADGASLHATVERRTESSDWAAIADVTADGTGNIVYQDRSVTPGTRYGYHVTWLDGATPRSGGETWVSVPLDLGVALESPRPNPVSGPARVGVTLPDARGARLDVIDLSGRCVASHDLAGLGAGRHVVPLDETAALAPGVYTIRLAAGGTVRLARLCVVR